MPTPAAGTAITAPWSSRHLGRRIEKCVETFGSRNLRRRGFTIESGDAGPGERADQFDGPDQMLARQLLQAEELGNGARTLRQRRQYRAIDRRIRPPSGSVRLSDLQRFRCGSHERQPLPARSCSRRCSDMRRAPRRNKS